MKSDTPTIAVITPFLDRCHGSERCLAEQVERIAHHYPVCVYTQRATGLDLSSGNISVRRIPGIPGPHIIKYIWFFVANHIVRGYDAAVRGARYPVRYSPCVNCLDANLIAIHILFHSLYRRRREPGASGCLSPRDGLRLLHRRIYYKLIMCLERLVYRSRNISMIYVSRRISREVRTHIGRSNPNDTVIHNGVDASYFNPVSREALRAVERRNTGIMPTDFVLLLIGNDWITKGLRTLIGAVTAAGDPRLKIVVVGTDTEAAFHKQVSAAGPGRVLFLPPHDDVLRFYALADAYVGPSLEDAFALPPLEAMACGLPVVVSSRAGVSELITDGDDGLILDDPDDAPGLAAKIVQLLRDPALCKALGLRARQTARSCTWGRNGALLKATIDTMLAEKRARDTVRVRQQ